MAAEVIPFTRLSPRNITPALKKPMPVAILDAMRFELFAAPITIDIIVKKQESIDIIIIVRMISLSLFETRQTYFCIAFQHLQYHPIGQPVRNRQVFRNQ